MYIFVIFNLTLVQEADHLEFILMVEHHNVYILITSYTLKAILLVENIFTVQNQSCVHKIRNFRYFLSFFCLELLCSLSASKKWQWVSNVKTLKLKKIPIHLLNSFLKIRKRPFNFKVIMSLFCKKF